ncbi:MAG: hypothetical protein BWY63_02594 [Chloroflexi bacterium ADurb.Bin360]|nr:MAG: hypothetical protein BWY63_02594 [Chloroflexi bacterium ADurb.Bin360]
MVARFLAWIGFAAVNHRTDARKSADDVIQAQLQCGEMRLDDLHEVGDFLRCDVWLGIEGLFMVEVRRSYQRDSLPGEDEDRATVNRVQETHRLRYRKAPCCKNKVTTAQWANARRCANLRSKCIRPCARCVDYYLRSSLGIAPGECVL